MSESSTTYFDDGGYPFDGLTFTYNSKVFLLEDFGPEEGSNWVQSNNIDGSPRGGRDIATVITGNGTALFPTGSSTADAPPRFTVITLPYRGATKSFVITKVGLPQKSGQEIKMSLSLRELLNSASATQTTTTGNPSV